MRKIDIKQSLDERVQSTEWTDKDTWKVLDRVRTTGKTREKHRLTFLIPAAALAILAIGIGIASIVHPGTPDLIRPSIQPLGISSNDGPASPDNGETAEAAQHPDVAAAISSLREEHPEIAEELHSKPGTVSVTKRNALNKLRDVFKDKHITHPSGRQRKTTESTGETTYHDQTTLSKHL